MDASGVILVQFVKIEKEMSNGQRCLDRTPLTDDEIKFLREQIRSIEADESVFVFNDSDHLKGSTCYNFERDLIFVTRNVYPDDRTGSIHPRDQLSPRAVLAHEYYGHRPERDRYLKEDAGTVEKMQFWKDEAYASINAAFRTPNLTQLERAMLLNEAFFRAEESAHRIKLTKDMKEILYGNWRYAPEKGIDGPIIFISATSIKRAGREGAR